MGICPDRGGGPIPEKKNSASFLYVSSLVRAILGVWFTTEYQVCCGYYTWSVSVDYKGTVADHKQNEPNKALQGLNLNLVRTKEIMKKKLVV